MKRSNVLSFNGAVLLLGALGGCGSEQPQPIARAGAVYTTFDAARGGCLDSQNGVNCNHYTSKWDVYASGGPTKAGLPDGDYYFAVLTPGAQNGGFIDGASGNLSDTTSGGTTGDRGSGDLVGNRTFRVANHDIVAYAGTHGRGTSPQGHSLIQLMIYDDTDNPGGVYILAVCEAGATSPSQCKYDAFKINPSCGDSHVNEGEACDDGNTTAGDGCSPTCTIEKPAPACGDAKLDVGEACDDGNTTAGDGCSPTCTIEKPVSTCGDAKLDVGEECDDGNLTDGDGCAATCIIECA